MSAPALVALAHGSRDARAAATITALTDLVACLRPELRVEPAFLERSEPSIGDVVARLAAEGHEEIVVVPLLFAAELTEEHDVAIAVAALREAYASVRIELAEGLGIDAAIFRVLDERLREVLAENRVRELDGLVLAGAGWNNPLANATIARAARTWGKVHHLPAIAAFASAAPPAAGEAVRQLRADGRRHIAVGMLFLASGRLEDRVRELALEAGAVAVAAPLGVHDEIAALILARYAVAAVRLVPLFA